MVPAGELPKFQREFYVSVGICLLLALLTVTGLMKMNRAAAAWQNGVFQAVQGQVVEARRSFDQALILWPGQPEYLFSRAKLCLMTGDLAQTANDLDEVQRRTPGDPRAVFTRGIMQGLDGRRSDALATFLQAEEMAGGPDFQIQIVRELIHLQGFEEARTLLQKIVRPHPALADAWLQLGNSYLQPDPEKAMDCYLRSLREREDVGKTWLNLAICQFRLGDLPACRRSLDRAVELQPDDHRVHYNRSILFGKLGRTQEAAEELEEANRLLKKAEGRSGK